MNLKRIILAGLAAGLVINVSEFILNGVVFADQMESYADRFASWAMPFYVALAFIWGIALAAVYAAVRPRLGPGPRTAAMVGIGFWVIAVLLASLSYLAMGLGRETIGVGLVWTFVEILLAATVAGWLYREEPQGAAGGSP